MPGAATGLRLCVPWADGTWNRTLRQNTQEHSARTRATVSLPWVLNYSVRSGTEQVRSAFRWNKVARAEVLA